MNHTERKNVSTDFLTNIFLNIERFLYFQYPHHTHNIVLFFQYPRQISVIECFKVNIELSINQQKWSKKLINASMLFISIIIS